MTAALAEAVALDGLWLLYLGAVLAGLVRGFTGFGTAMVFLPIAGQVMDPVAAVVALLLIDFIGPLPAVPRALREGHVADVVRLGLGTILGAPLGLAILVVLSPEAFRSLVGVLALGLLAALISGVRYRGRVGRPMIYGIGALAGVFYGAAGMPGPPVILLYMARPLHVQVIRASVLLFLVLADVVMVAVFAIGGLLAPVPLAVGFALLPAYALAVWAGSRIFDPARAGAYRRVAYAVIAGSALSGLPIWT